MRKTLSFGVALTKASSVYRPDAIVKMRNLAGQSYCFIIEFERTRNAKAIYDEKLRHNEKMPSFKELGLPGYTKILYVCSHEWMNVFLRPMQYEKEDKRGIEAIAAMTPIAALKDTDRTVTSTDSAPSFTNITASRITTIESQIMIFSFP